MRFISRHELPAVLWLWAPVTALVVLAMIVVFFPGMVASVIESEGGLVELGTPLLLLPAVIAGILCFVKRRLLPAQWLSAWLMLVTLACIYIAGEELSWGQQLFGWNTPEAMQAINDQQETNIHNISSWFDQKPRLLLELWVLIGGVILVLWRQYRGIQYTTQDWRYWFWPGTVCFPVSLISILVKMPERFENIAGFWLFGIHVRTSELQEFFFAWFLMIYLLSCYNRLKILMPELKSDT